MKTKTKYLLMIIVSSILTYLFFNVEPGFCTVFLLLTIYWIAMWYPEQAKSQMRKMHIKDLGISYDKSNIITHNIDLTRERVSNLHANIDKIAAHKKTELRSTTKLTDEEITKLMRDQVDGI